MPLRFPVSSFRVLSVGVVLGGLVAAPASPALAADQPIVRVNVSSTGEQVAYAESSWEAVVSDGGRVTAFHSFASNLVPNDTNSAQDIFIHDALTRTTDRVSVSSDGQQADSGSYRPKITPDGRYVAFFSYASNLVKGDTNGTEDIFVHDRLAGTTTRVNVSSEGEPIDVVGNFQLSADGRYVTFSDVVRLNVGQPGRERILVRDLLAGTTTQVNLTSGGKPSSHPGQTSYAGVSAVVGGRYMAFESSASDLVDGDTNNTTDIFVRDMTAGTTSRVSVSSEEQQASAESTSPALSADGRYVSFTSRASNLVDGDTNRWQDIFVRDMTAGTTTRVSVPSTAQPDYSSDHNDLASISADGRYVAFLSSASNLVAGDTNREMDVFVRDLHAGVTTRVNVSADGQQANSETFNSSISPDGRYVVFISRASNLVNGDTNLTADVFVRRLA